MWTPSDPMVSAQHAKVVRLPAGYVLIDLESTNGTYLNGRRIQRATLPTATSSASAPAARRSACRCSSPSGRRWRPRPRSSSPASPSWPAARRRARASRSTRWRHGVVRAGQGPRVRRPPRLAHREPPPRAPEPPRRRGDRRGPRQRQRHLPERARASRGRRWRPATCVVVGPFQLVVERAPAADDRGSQARRASSCATPATARASTPAAISVRAGGHAILQDVSLSVGPGSFVAVIGPSGSGKSTLLSVLSGIRAATAGEVLLNGGDLHRAFDALKSRLGYVPQDDIVHRELTVEESLDYTARLRLPAGHARRGARQARRRRAGHPRADRAPRRCPSTGSPAASASGCRSPPSS